MYTDIRDWIHSCIKCQEFSPNLSASKYTALIPLIATEHNQVVVIDVKGPYTATDRGNRLILTITDSFTRWPEAYPMRNGDSDEILELFVNEYVARFGMPQRLVSDQGKPFISRTLSELCDYLMIRKITSTPYHPQLQGQDEATNKSIGHALRKFCSENPHSWDRMLPLILFSLRITQAQNGDTPFYNLYHHDPRLPMELTLAPAIKPTVIPESKATEMYDKAREAYQHIMDITERSKQDLVRRDSEDHDFPTYQVKDLVWCAIKSLKPNQSNKLRPLFEGPFVIVQMRNPKTYVVQRRGTEETYSIGVALIKPYVTRRLSDVLVDWQKPPPANPRPVLPTPPTPDLSHPLSIPPAEQVPGEDMFLPFEAEEEAAWARMMEEEEVQRVMLRKDKGKEKTIKETSKNEEKDKRGIEDTQSKEDEASTSRRPGRQSPRLQEQVRKQARVDPEKEEEPLNSEKGKGKQKRKQKEDKEAEEEVQRKEKIQQVPSPPGRERGRLLDSPRQVAKRRNQWQSGLANDDQRIEKILNHDFDNGVLIFEVQWKDDTGKSWHTKEEMINAPQSLEDYYQRRGQKSKMPNFRLFVELEELRNRFHHIRTAFPLVKWKQELKVLVGDNSPYNFSHHTKEDLHRRISRAVGRSSAIALTDEFIEQFKTLFKPVPNVKLPIRDRNASVDRDDP